MRNGHFKWILRRAARAVAAGLCGGGRRGAGAVLLNIAHHLSIAAGSNQVAPGGSAPDALAPAPAPNRPTVHGGSSESTAGGDGFATPGHVFVGDEKGEQGEPGNGSQCLGVSRIHAKNHVSPVSARGTAP